MRQRERGGGRFVDTLAAKTQPQSHYLTTLGAVVTDDLLDQLDAKLQRLDANANKEDIEEVFAHFFGSSTSLDEAAERGLKYAVKLALFTLKRQRKQPGVVIRMRELNHEIARRTDEIYVAQEDVPTQQGTRSMNAIFERAMQALAKRVAEDAQSKPMELSFGAPKDPVRIVEKAEDDYAAYFSDGVAAEACVVDVLRARGICCRPEDLLFTQDALLDPKGVTLVDEEISVTVRLEVARVKSKFGSDRDPTHFRNLLNNLLMTVTCSDGKVRTTFVELQLHEKGILKHNNDNDAHDHYDYFRSLLESSYDSDLDKFLERTILFLQEVAGNPVLLSMLVLLFGEADDAAAAPSVPTNRYELYMLVLSKVVTRRLGASTSELRELHPSAAMDMLRTVAVANYVAKGRREFTSEDVRLALGEENLQLWSALASSLEGVPLVKPIVEAKEGGRVDGLFQFKHLSFQEALSGQFLVQVAAGQRQRQLFAVPFPAGGRAEPLQMLAASDRAVGGFLNRVLNKNTAVIGGGELGTALAAEIDCWDFMRGIQLNPQGIANMLPLLTGNHNLRALHFSLSSDASALYTLGLESVLSGCTSLAELSISAVRDWEFHLPSDKNLPGSRSLELMLFISRLIQTAPALKRLSLFAGPSLTAQRTHAESADPSTPRIPKTDPKAHHGSQRHALRKQRYPIVRLDEKAAEAAASAARIRARASARAEDVRRALEMMDAVVDGELESFNGVPIRAIRRADVAEAECDLRRSGPEAGTALPLTFCLSPLPFGPSPVARRPSSLAPATLQPYNLHHSGLQASCSLQPSSPTPRSAR